MRSSAQVLIYLDIEKALADGVPLFISENKVLLSPGINGIIEPKYFKCAVDRSGKVLLGKK
jgi:2'-phosphotransferase